MSKLNILASWGICTLMTALVATAHSATAQAYPHTSDGEAYLNIAVSGEGSNFGAAMNPLTSTDWALSNAAPAITSFNGNSYYAWTIGPDMCEIFLNNCA